MTGKPCWQKNWVTTRARGPQHRRGPQPADAARWRCLHRRALAISMTCARLLIADRQARGFRLSSRTGLPRPDAAVRAVWACGGPVGYSPPAAESSKWWEAQRGRRTPAALSAGSWWRKDRMASGPGMRCKFSGGSMRISRIRLSDSGLGGDGERWRAPGS